MTFEVSVIIPVYNAERFVAEAVASALAQPEVGEVLLVEDASPDGALAVCEKLAAEDERVRVLRHPGGENRGAAASRNLGIEHASCPFIAFLDADDYFLPDRFTAARQRFEHDPKIDGVYEAVGTEFESDQMRQWWEAKRSSNLTTVREGVEPEQLFAGLVDSSAGYFHTNGIVVRRELFERTGLFDTGLRMCQDSAMWFRMAAVGRLVGGSLTEPIAMRRLHGDNRIFKQEREHHRYRAMQWFLLLDFLRARRLHPELRADLLDKALRSWSMGRPAESTVRRIAAEVGLLAKLAATRPWTLGKVAYWRQVRRLVSLARLRRIARETVAKWPGLDKRVRRLAGRSASS